MLACLIEVTSMKAGNVHPGASFSDMTHADFYKSAIAVKEAIESVEPTSIGHFVWTMVDFTRSRVSVNTNLGTVLLFAPLIKASCDLAVPIKRELGGTYTLAEAKHYDSDRYSSNRFRIDVEKAIQTSSNTTLEDCQNRMSELFERMNQLQQATCESLQKVTANDACGVFDGISKANPSGLGRVDEMDVEQMVGRTTAKDVEVNRLSSSKATFSASSLMDAMRLAEGRDDVARQYSRGFEDVFRISRELIDDLLSRGDWLNALRFMQIKMLSNRLDSHIVRKNGIAAGEDVRSRATAVLHSGNYGSLSFETAWRDLDCYLRRDGHKLNPGTTADLLAAAVWVVLWAVGTLP